jgi:hypothetical protein
MQNGIGELVGRNESLFRNVNEALKAGRWPGELEAPVGFRCECGELGCTRVIDIKLQDYERIRAHPRRFIVAIDHEMPAAESVVERHEKYLVVEKHGDAGRVADQEDPRG